MGVHIPIVEFNKAISHLDGVFIDHDDDKYDRALLYFDRLAILKTLKACNGNKTHAAKILGVSRYFIREKLKKIKAHDDQRS